MNILYGNKNNISSNLFIPVVSNFQIGRLLFEKINNI